MSNDTDIDKARRQIRALLNLGNDDGATQAEAENALRFARRLMLRHNLNEGDVVERARDPHEIAADTEYGQVHSFTQLALFSKWENYLSYSIAELVGTVKHYLLSKRERRTSAGTLEFDHKGRPKKSCQVVWYGPREDCDMAAGLFEEWSLTIVSMARLKYGNATQGPGRSYAEGFASTLLQRARDMAREEQKQIADQKAGMLNVHESSTALVLLRATDVMTAKKQRADAWLRETSGIRLRQRSASYSSRHDSDAYAAGRADGSRANFQRGERTRRLGQ